jgi:BON domain-containing protein
MEEQKRGGEPRNEPSEDYYSGYYWGNNPYDSSTVAGHKSDEELKNSIIENIKKNNNIDSSKIEVYVNNSTVILKGVVDTYEERRLAGQAAWNVSGVSKVLNDLQVAKPETAGPGRVSGSS